MGWLLVRRLKHRVHVGSSRVSAQRESALAMDEAMMARDKTHATAQLHLHGSESLGHHTLRCAKACSDAFI